MTTGAGVSADSAGFDASGGAALGSVENASTASDVEASGTDDSNPTRPAAANPGALADWLLVGLITLLTAWTAVLGMAFLPLHIGAIPFPISALLGVGAMILAPRACYRLTHSLIAALLPVAAWFAVSVWLVLARNSLLGGLPVTVINGQWRVMVLLGLGSLAAAATVGLIWGDRLRDRLAAERAVAQARDDAWTPDPPADQD